ncbi:hypothetical protein ABFU27_07365 [Xanthomonas campestris pv. raphani]|uniref:hypothetical protein n=1 Tax=Xanthomonas campestris TaxID=339 RepID=UPI001E51A693|nr:hypothetical protein [Xanthomonas campestris]MCC8686417.1 hypothetical protein [Xanthomonas campestris]MCC8691635.1 hypothetical protein [Xanthomonas campestris]MCW1998506.1 hypothetical protein [Xanthomonas campestris]MEA9678650.1 hypothetical protein [Xanthomonas campestris pv. raphani]MEA9698033.1 hypothetical protein [Xanthomonas campestris pv. raphani]
MGATSLEEIIATEIGEAAVGTGHSVDGGRYEGTVEVVDIDDCNIQPDPHTPGVFTVNAKGTCTIRHIDAEHAEHVSECEIEIDAQVSITPTSHDRSSSSLSASVEVDVSSVNIVCDDDEDKDIEE